MDQEIYTLAETISRVSADKPKEPDVSFGTVASASGKYLDVLVDGATTPNRIVRACGAITGSRVVIVKKGTVWLAIAVVGGGPTIESGSNANGHYRKHPDGTLECWNTVPLASTYLSSPLGTGYISSTPFIWTYPLQFVSMPSISITPSTSAGSWCFINPVTTSYATGYLAGFIQGPTQVGTIAWFAIGKWK